MTEKDRSIFPPSELLLLFHAVLVEFYKIRSLNLANSVSIVLYEALRQNRFGELNPAGQLHRLHWNGET